MSGVKLSYSKHEGVNMFIYQATVTLTVQT
uniref:Uncharacterized protein n=1 Tax=Arundo donax TaxID=35708 RepID=A0A0A8ZQF7_ARUDO